MGLFGSEEQETEALAGELEGLVLASPPAGGVRGQLQIGKGDGIA
jgi:hypothetical protein